MQTRTLSFVVEKKAVVQNVIGTIGTRLVVVGMCLFSAFSQAALMKKVLPMGEQQWTYYLEPYTAAPDPKTLMVVIADSSCNSVANTPQLDFFREIWPTADLIIPEKPGVDRHLPFVAGGHQQDCPRAFRQRDNIFLRQQQITQIIEHEQLAHDYQRVLLVGIRTGGVIAALVAGQREDITAVMMVNSGSRHYLRDLEQQIKSRYHQAQQRQHAWLQWQKWAQKVMTHPPFVVDKPQHGYRWWRTRLNNDQQQTLAKLTMPVLVVQGDADQHVDVAGVMAMMGQLQQQGRRQLSFISVPKLTHDLHNQQGDERLYDVVGFMRLWLNNAASHAVPDSWYYRH